MIAYASVRDFYKEKAFDTLTTELAFAFMIWMRVGETKFRMAGGEEVKGDNRGCESRRRYIGTVCSESKTRKG